MKKIIDSVAVLLSYQNEILIIQRQNHLHAFPGYWAFPGGKVEAVDFSDGEFFFKEELSQSVENACFREIKEELGIDFRLERTMISSLKEVGVALSPAFNPIRFSTHFVHIELNKKPSLQVDEDEIFCAHWRTKEQLLDQYRNGNLLVVPPVLSLIETFGFDQMTCSLRLDHESDIPFVESLYKLRQYMPLSNTLPPAERTNCFVIDEKIVVDPSPKNEQEFDLLLAQLRHHPLEILFITHQHPDHYERANRIARELKLPVYISLDSYSRICSKFPDFFADLKIYHPKDGEVIGEWLGKKINVMEVPGHDEGQLALMPETKEWFIAGDLFQGMGSVVIGGEEGNMKKYMLTLEKVININPKVLYPSHGIGLGGVNILKKNLEHRKLREDQVLRLIQMGHQEEEILTHLYSDIPQNLQLYARENIKKHIEKLKEEGRI